MSSYKDTTLAVQSYALALYQASKAQGNVDAVLADAVELGKTLGAQPRLRAFLESPQVPHREKHALVKNVFGDRLPQLLLNLAAILIDRERELLLEGILEAFEQLVEREKGILPASITTARPLSPEDQARLQAAADKFTGRKLRIAFRIDPAILGGVVFRFRDTLVDGSLRRRLRNLRERFLSSAA